MYAVKNEVIQLVIALMALCIGGAAEELLPKIAGVGFPFLMASSVFMAMSLHTSATVMFAVAAGAIEEAPAFSLPSPLLPVGVSFREAPLCLHIRSTSGGFGCGPAERMECFSTGC